MFQFVHQLKNLKTRKDLPKSEQAKLMAEIKLPQVLSFISKQTTWVVIAGMWFGATFFTLLFVNAISQLAARVPAWVQLGMYSVALGVFAFSFVLIGAFFAFVGRGGMIAGKFPRSPSHPIYALRRFFGAAWTQVFYFKPLYAVFLAIPALKTLLFKLYGYKGSTDFVLYPDAWVRDLPLLHIGKGAYVANRCTIGSNICLSDGSIIVGDCHIGEKTIVGHLVIFGLGCRLGNNSELGIGVAMGIRVTYGENVSIAPKTSIYHGAEIGNDVKIGPGCFIGQKAKIGNGVELKLGAIIPNGAVVATQADADKYFSSEMDMLRYQKDNLNEILRKNIDGFESPN